MAVSKIQSPVQYDVLYEGDKWTTGTKTLTNYASYDFLLLKMRTNAEYFVDILPIVKGAFAGTSTVFDHNVWASDSGWLHSRLYMTGGANSTMNVSVASNNANWTLGIIKIVGVKF